MFAKKFSKSAAADLLYVENGQSTVMQFPLIYSSFDIIWTRRPLLETVGSRAGRPCQIADANHSDSPAS